MFFRVSLDCFHWQYFLEIVRSKDAVPKRLSSSCRLVSDVAVILWKGICYVRNS